MSVAIPLLPILAMLSGEASAMDARAVAVADQETALQAILATSAATTEAPRAADAPQATEAAATSGGQAASEAGPTPEAPPAAETPPAPVAPAPAADEPAQSAAGQVPPDPSPDLDADDSLLPGRRRPGSERRLPERVEQDNPGAVRPPPPEAFPTDEFPVPDRWRLVESLGVVKEHWWDPYHQNTYKGDRPLCLQNEEERERRRKEGLPKCMTPAFLGFKADDWFLTLNAISDTVVEPRSFPQPVNRQSIENPGSNDVFGRANSLVLAQTFIVGAALTKGSTAYKPPEIEYRVALAINTNYADVSERRVLRVEPSYPTHRNDSFVGVQEFFVDYHIRNTSDRYDFDSIRVGIQPLQLDFRGFLFNDNNLAIRLFGTRDNNRFQYSVGAIWRLEKDTNSGLNNVTVRPRDDFVIFGNLFRQDFPVVGLTSQAIGVFNINREDKIHIDDNGFPNRPSLLGDLRPFKYEVFYPGYAVDGRIGRINISAQLYGAFGEISNNFFTSRPADIRAYFGAAEVSYDHDWIRFRLSGVYASGDSKPYDNVLGGFDAIFENPIIAGADTSYWIRQVIPFAGGARAVGINTRNGILNSLRSSKEEGQSNFNNPGLVLFGVGTDFDITPTFRLSTNVNHIAFENTSSLKALRNEGSIPKSIGWDLSAAAIWRPKGTQNIVVRLSGAVLQPSKGFADLFTNNHGDDRYYSVLLNVILAY